jgi:YfiH family protein
VTARRILTSRPGGASRGPYASFNLSPSVGDAPEAVAANRDRLAAATGHRPGQIAWMAQVHGSTVAVVDRAPRDPVPATDGLVTATPDVLLAVLVADCVPMLLADTSAGVVGAVHAGRRGAAAGIAARAVAAMTGVGAVPATIDVLLGPAICGACYEVPAGMRDEVEAALPGSASTTRQGTPALDLRAGLARQLADLGVARIVVDPRCTFETPELYSHRRDEPTGRFAGVAWVTGG